MLYHHLRTRQLTQMWAHLFIVCTFSALVFVKEDGPQPASCSSAGICVIITDCFECRTRFKLNHKNCWISTNRKLVM